MNNYDRMVFTPNLDSSSFQLVNKDFY